jgi:hypothetical protein
MLRHVALVRTDVSEELSISIIRVTRIDEPGTLTVRLPILFTVMMEALTSSETSVLTRATWRNIPEDAILQHIVCHPTISRNVLSRPSRGVTYKDVIRIRK